MSYILAALNKAEKERQAGSGVPAGTPQPAVVASRRPWWVALLVSMLGSALVLALYLLWQGQGSVSVGASDPPPSAPQAAAAHQETTAPGGSPAAGPEPVEAPESIQQAAVAARPASVAVTPVPGAVTEPDASQPTLRGMVAHNEISPPSSPESLVRMPEPITGSPKGSVIWETEPLDGTDLLAAEPILDELSEIPVLHSLPAHVRAQLPPLELNVHVYSDSPAKRFVYINSERCGEGSQLEGGVVLEKIIPNGVVMRQGGVRFRLLMET